MVWIKHYASKLAQAVSVGLDRRFPVCRTGGVTAQEYSGGVITLLVLFTSREDNKRTLNETLENERCIQERNEIMTFSQLIIEKNAVFSIEIEELIYKTHSHINQKEKQQDSKESMDECLKTFRIVRSILVEISMHLEIVDGKKAYCSEGLNKLIVTVEVLIEFVKSYKSKILECKIDDKLETEIFKLSNALFNQTQEYLKNIKGK